MKRNLAVGTATLVSLVSGCYTPTPMPVIPFEQCTYKFQTNDYQIGIEPFENEEEARAVSTRGNILEKRILPVYVTIANSSGSLLVFDPDNFTISCGGKYPWINATPTEIAHLYDNEDSIKSMVIGVVSQPAAFMDMARQIKNRQTADSDNKDKRFSNQVVLYPGSREAGVFFQRPAKGCEREFEAFTNHGTIQFVIYLDGQGTKKLNTRFDTPQLAQNETN